MLFNYWLASFLVHYSLGQNTMLGRSNGSSMSASDMLATLERGGTIASYLSAQDPYCIEKAAKMHRTAAGNAFWLPYLWLLSTYFAF